MCVCACVCVCVFGIMYSNLVFKSSTRGSWFPVIPPTNVLSIADRTQAEKNTLTNTNHVIDMP
jgi:hypothetical protein